MIPKKIHWCWFSDDPLPQGAVECRETWAKVLPDYKVVLWNLDALSEIKLPSVILKALTQRKWALVADYIRLYAVYTHGGIYFDSDVMAVKPFSDEMLSDRFFTATEFFESRVTGLQAAIFGAEAGHPFLGDCLEYYNNLRGEDESKVLRYDIIAPPIYADIAKTFGFDGEDREQLLQDGMRIYAHPKLAGYGDQVTEDTVVWHVCHGHWWPWKHKAKRVMMAIPYVGHIETGTWESIIKLERPKNTEMEVKTYAKYSCAMARNVAAKDAVAGGFDYVFFVDSDVILPPDALTRLLKIDADLAMGWYLYSQTGTETSAAVYDAEKMFIQGWHIDVVKSHAEPFAVDGGGLGCALIRTSVFSDVEYPYYRYIEYGNGDTLSEDYQFCLAIREKGKKMVCDPALRVGHIKNVVV